LEHVPRIAYVSTYPPRACGIGTFTRDLARAVLMGGHVATHLVVAINEEPNSRYYDTNVKFTIDQFNRESYVFATNLLNTLDLDVVNLQHEYGIFGGEWGEYVLDLCRNIEKPLVSTFHTVLRNPCTKARQVLNEIAELSNTVVVTIESAAQLLEKRFGVDANKIKVIPHGAALPDRQRNKHAKRQLGLSKHTVLATYGLINPGKGVEYAIESLSHLVKERPNLLFLVIGETHPEVRKREGEVYRSKLVSLVKRLRLERHVRFVDRYLHDDELSQYLQAVDIYLAPYLSKEQVSSGTLTLALGHGKAVVSTPTVFAEEVLSNDLGLLCRFADADSLAECVARILDDSKLRRELEAHAFKYGQEVGWTKVADQYGEIFRSFVRGQGTVGEATAVSEA
jgi:glycosyltransferase involved in cell wall biosynthesis